MKIVTYDLAKEGEKADAVLVYGGKQYYFKQVIKEVEESF